MSYGSKHVLVSLTLYPSYLHISILDTIVYHLDIVSSSVLTYPVTARFTISFSTYTLEYWLDVFPKRKKALILCDANSAMLAYQASLAPPGIKDGP